VAVFVRSGVANLPT